MAKVFIGPSLFKSLPDWEFARVIRAAGHEVVFHNEPEQLLEHQVLQLLKGMDAVVAGSGGCGEAALDCQVATQAVACGAQMQLVTLLECERRPGIQLVDGAILFVYLGRLGGSGNGAAGFF